MLIYLHNDTLQNVSKIYTRVSQRGFILNGVNSSKKLKKQLRKIVAVLNTKGGEGKTTLVIHLATCLSRMGYKVLVVDTDPQQSFVNWYQSGVGQPVFDVMATHKPAELEHLDQIPDDYDYVLVDGAATLNDTTAAVIVNADLVLIPIKASPLSFAATSAVMDCIRVREKRGKIKVRFCLTMYQQRAALNIVLTDTIKQVGHKYLRTPMYARQVYPRSLFNGGTVYDDKTRPGRQAAGEIDNITRELLEVIHYE